MTIARRILLLAAAAPLVLVALGVLSQIELSSIEARSRFVAQKQVPSLSTLGNVSRTFEEMRVVLRDHLRATDAAAQARARAGLAARRSALGRLLLQSGDRLDSREQ